MSWGGLRILGSISVDCDQNCYQVVVKSLCIGKEWTNLKAVLLSILGGLLSTKHANDHSQRNCSIFVLAEIWFFRSLTVLNSVNLGRREKALIQCLISLSLENAYGTSFSLVPAKWKLRVLKNEIQS